MVRMGFLGINKSNHGSHPEIFVAVHSRDESDIHVPVVNLADHVANLLYRRCKQSTAHRAGPSHLGSLLTPKIEKYSWLIGRQECRRNYEVSLSASRKSVP